MFAVLLVYFFNEHFRKNNLMATRFKVCAGEKFNRLTVISGETVSDGKKTGVMCKCDCGNTKIVERHQLKSGHTKSCGCLLKEKYERQTKDQLTDITGNRYGRLVVIKQEYVHGRKWATVECDCGTVKIIKSTGSLTHGCTSSCGCLRKEVTAAKKFKDLTGQKFGRLTVIKQDANLKTRVRWKCKCDCGQIVSKLACTLVNGGTRSCGCLNIETVTTHGLSKHCLYNTWTGIKQRCFNSNHHEYYNYGGRGIKVCDRWVNGEKDKHAFVCFLEDMGEKPDGEYHSLDRIDPDGDYCPENCRWGNNILQANNKRKKVFQSELLKSQEETEYWKKEYQLILEDNKRLNSLIAIS
jgi:hypothetical protein